MEEERGALVEAWPLFGLVIRTRAPGAAPADRQPSWSSSWSSPRHGIHDADYMPFGYAWTDKPSPQFERDYLQYHWRTRSTWSADEWMLDLGVWADGQLVGTQGMRGEKFAVFRWVGTGSWLGREFQGRKIGREMRAAALVVRVRPPRRGARDE